MTVKTDRYLECDGCGRIERFGFQHYSNTTSKALRHYAINRYWSYVHYHKDYCLECTEKNKGGSGERF